MFEYMYTNDDGRTAGSANIPGTESIAEIQQHQLQRVSAHALLVLVCRRVRIRDFDLVTSGCRSAACPFGFTRFILFLASSRPFRSFNLVLQAANKYAA